MKYNYFFFLKMIKNKLILFAGDGGNQLEAKLEKPSDNTGTFSSLTLLPSPP